MPNVEEIFQKNLPQIVKFWFGFDEGNRGNKNMILRARPYTAIKAEEEALLKEMGKTFKGPFPSLFFVYFWSFPSKYQYDFFNKSMRKNVQPVNGAGDLKPQSPSITARGARSNG